MLAKAPGSICDRNDSESAIVARSPCEAEPHAGIVNDLAADGRIR